MQTSFYFSTGEDARVSKDLPWPYPLAQRLRKYRWCFDLANFRLPPGRV